MTPAPPRTLVVPQAEITDALIGFLVQAVDRPIGDHSLPQVRVNSETVPAPLENGYAIVYSIDGGGFDGPPLWSPESGATLVYQVTSVAGLRGQAQWIADRVRLSLFSRRTDGGFQVPFPSPAGWNVYHRAPEAGLPGVYPEGDEPNLVFNIQERFRLSVEPTT